jgi:hypothetical protein
LSVMYLASFEVSAGSSFWQDPVQDSTSTAAAIAARQRADDKRCRLVIVFDFIVFILICLSVIMLSGLLPSVDVGSGREREAVDGAGERLPAGLGQSPGRKRMLFRLCAAYYPQILRIVSRTTCEWLSLFFF